MAQNETYDYSPTESVNVIVILQLPIYYASELGSGSISFMVYDEASNWKKELAVPKSVEAIANYPKTSVNLGSQRLQGSVQVIVSSLIGPPEKEVWY